MESRHQPVWLAEEADKPDEDGPDLFTVEEAAVYLRVAPKWIYANAREIGGFRLLGDRGPWRFPRRELPTRRERLGAVPARPPHDRRSRASGRRTTPSGVPILPSEPRRETR